MDKHKTYKSNWYEFTTGWSGFHLVYHISGYYDTKPHLQIYFVWGKLFIYFPWVHYKKIEREKNIKEKRKDKLNQLLDKKNKLKKVYRKVIYDECDPPKYGIYFFMKQFCISYGKNTKMYDLPWSHDWIRTSALTKDEKWIHEVKGKSMNFWDDRKWKDILFQETYPYVYTTDNGIVQNCMATIRVEAREWRWHWFKYLKYPRYIRKDIEVDFSTDIGERKGGWKGGCTACSYEMLDKETPYETLKRMEKERRFK